MGNYFNTLNIGLRGLQAQKKSLDVTSHNIANANTEGYSRQRAVHSTTDPHAAPGYGMPEGAGQVGTGVEIEEINRIKDQFVEGQIWEKKQSQSYWNRRSDGLGRIENIFNEPSDNNLSSAFDKFWQSLEDLSNNPEDSAVRATVKERANTLVDSFHSIDEQLSDYKSSLNDDVNTTVDEINSLGKRISDLNGQIAHIKGTGKNPNDLMDTRDKLIEELNQKVNVRTRKNDRGYINVSIGGMSFVAGDEVNELTTEKVSGSPDEDIIKFDELDRKADIKNGELAALLDLRGTGGDGILPDQKEKLDNIANTFANEFNDKHNSGYDLNKESGEDFFLSDDGDISADSIILNGTIDNDVSKIAAGSLSDNRDVVTAEDDGTYNGDEYAVTIDKDNSTYTLENLSTNTTVATDAAYTGDSFTAEGLTFNVEDSGTAFINNNVGSGDNALNLADTIKSDELDFNNDGDVDATVMGKYESVISSLGVQGQRANQMVENQDTLVNQLENKRESISGVSLDEEMANMIKYQQAYSASAKLISNADRMMDSLMGILR
ncbi:MAG: flagellar hook-associated protein FlgK [Bacillota bacterium]